MCLQCPTVGPSSYGLAVQKCRNHILSSDIESMVSEFEQAGENKVEKTPEEIRKRRKLALAIGCWSQTHPYSSVMLKSWEPGEDQPCHGGTSLGKVRCLL